MKLLVIDNYDSFTYNLVQYFRELLGHRVDVLRNDRVELAQAADYDVLVFSPGPGLPSEAGMMPALLKIFAPSKVILGVCLGHQAIGEAFGAELLNLSQVYHGVSTPIYPIVSEDVLFEGLPEVFEAGRYHSWVVDKVGLPEELEVTAVDANDEIMAMRHRSFDVFGLQFHPESVMTPLGKQMLENFVSYARSKTHNTVCS
jgi:anthranilate synthase component 2